MPLASVVSLALALACGDGGALTPPPPVPDRDLYWSLDLNHHAVTMSWANPLYDTLTLAATPRNRFGEALAGLGTPTFTSPNPDQLLVSPEGKLIAVASTTAPLPVVATLTVGNLKNVDTVYVAVTNNPSPPVLTTFSAHPLDSAKFGAGAGPVLPVRATDLDGNPIPKLLVSFRSADPLVLRFLQPTNGNMFGAKPGTTSVYASTTAYGITKSDTIPFRVGWPIFRFMSFGPKDFNPATIVVGTGALLLWAPSGGADSVDMVFADADLQNVVSPITSADAIWDLIAQPFGLPGSFARDFYCRPVVDCGAGNAALAAYVARVFRVPGTYEYHSERYGTSGRIIVMDER